MSTPTARSYPKRSRQSTGIASLNARRGGRPRRSGAGDFVIATGDNASSSSNQNHDENNENDIKKYDNGFENTEDGDHHVMMLSSGGGGGSSASFVSSSAPTTTTTTTTTTTSHTFLPKRRKTNPSGTGTTITTPSSSSTNQRWVKVHRRPMAPTNELYFGSSPFASFTVPTWVKLQDLTKEERVVYDGKIEEEKKTKTNNNIINATKSQPGERRDSSRDGGVTEVVVPSASEILLLSVQGQKESEKIETPSPTNVGLSADCAISTNPTTNAGAKVIEGTNNPLMTINLEGLKEDDKVKLLECGSGDDAVMELPLDSSLSMVEKDADISTETVRENNHVHEAEIIGGDRREIYEGEDKDDEEEGEIEEDYQETYHERS